MGSARSTTGKHSNIHRLPKSAIPQNVQSEQVSVATPGPSKIFEEVWKAVALLRESLCQALRAVWSDFENRAVLGFLNFLFCWRHRQELSLSYYPACQMQDCSCFKFRDYRMK